jgi:hypothetical protein
MAKKSLDELYVKALAAAKEQKAAVKAENIRRYGSEKAARKVSPIYRAYPSAKVLKLALVDGTWYSVDKVHGDPQSWDKKKLFFFGIGSGYDIVRILIKADNEQAAIEAAEDKYPKFFFTKIISRKALEQLEKKGGTRWDENPDNYRFIESIGKWGLPEEDIRIMGKVSRYVPSAATTENSREAILPDGTKVEYA